MTLRLPGRLGKFAQVLKNALRDESGTAVSVFPSPLSVFNGASSSSSYASVPADHWRGVISMPGVFSGSRPLVAAAGNPAPEYQAVKRVLDIAGALFFLVLFSPILITVYSVLMITTRGKPFFGQERVGHCGERFKMYKFRTMRLDADKLQHLVQNEKDGPIFKNRQDPRITRLGRWLRKTSIDEMPQLVSVLLGHMSLVGPRPPVPKEVAKYKAWQRRRLSVKPGLTCLWQVSGRSDVGFDDWVRMDIWYVQNQSLWTDLSLLVRTPLTVITCKGAY